MSGWQAIAAAARKPAQALSAALADPPASQQRLLTSILQANAQSEYGRLYGFSRIKTIDDFRNAVPVCTYADLAPSIARMAAGEPGVLTAAPVVAFEETGGSQSGGKLIALTAAGLAAYRAAILPWLHDLLARRPAIAAGTSYVAISPATRTPTDTPGGLPVGLASDAAYLGHDLAAAFASLLAVPPEVGHLADVEAWRVTTLAHLVSAPDLSFVSVWSPTFLLELIDALPGCADAVAERVDKSARDRLAKALSSAAVDTTLLWPRLDTISCWADGASQVYARRLGDACPHAALQAKGLMATEAAMTLPWGEGPGAVPALTSTVLEFVGENGQAYGAHQLKLGTTYRVLVTAHGGLYRYDMGDMVRCVGLEQAAPRLAFEGRATFVSDLVGEKLDEAFVARALSCLRVPAALRPRTAPKPHYELWVDAAAQPTPDEIGRVEEQLRHNPQYAYARRIGQLGPLVTVPRPGFRAEFHAQESRSGRRLGDLKPLAIIRSDQNRP